MKLLFRVLKLLVKKKTTFEVTFPNIWSVMELVNSLFRFYFSPTICLMDGQVEKKESDTSVNKRTLQIF